MSDLSTVGALRALLADESLPDDMPVVLSGDSEGNRFGLLGEAGVAMYASDGGEAQTWLLPEELAAKLADPCGITGGWTEDDAAPDDAVRALVLWPC